MAKKSEEPTVPARCLLRVSVRLNKLDRGYDNLLGKFNHHSQALEGHIEAGEKWREDNENALKGLSKEISHATALLHKRVNQTLRLFWGLMISVAGFIIVALMSLVLKMAYDGLPWQTAMSLSNHIFGG